MSHLFSFTCPFSRKEFKSQSARNAEYSEIINADSVEELFNKIWLYCEGKLEGGIKFVYDLETNGRKPVFLNKQVPDKGDLKNYILFFQKWDKKTKKVVNVKIVLLQKWLGREIGVYMHVHSLGIPCKTDWKLASELLLDSIPRDWSGAPSNASNIIKNQIPDQLYGSNSRNTIN